MSPILASIVRTFVPALVGTLIALGIRFGVDLPENALTAVLEPIVIGVYYAVARLLEEYVSPAWGKLLGLASKPNYDAA